MRVSLISRGPESRGLLTSPHPFRRLPALDSDGSLATNTVREARRDVMVAS
jgi:hypothetical protein